MTGLPTSGFFTRLHGIATMGKPALGIRCHYRFPGLSQRSIERPVRARFRSPQSLPDRSRGQASSFDLLSLSKGRLNRRQAGRIRRQVLNTESHERLSPRQGYGCTRGDLYVGMAGNSGTLAQRDCGTRTMNASGRLPPCALFLNLTDPLLVMRVERPTVSPAAAIGHGPAPVLEMRLQNCQPAF